MVEIENKMLEKKDVAIEIENEYNNNKSKNKNKKGNSKKLQDGAIDLKQEKLKGEAKKIEAAINSSLNFDDSLIALENDCKNVVFFLMCFIVVTLIIFVF